MDLLSGRPAIYARFSSSRQDERSIDDQVRRCREHLGDYNGEVVVYADYAVSGAGLNRPGFEAMMAAVDAGLVTSIITEDISRISRDFADAANIFKKLQYARVPLIGVADGIDTSAKHAKLTAALAEALTQRVPHSEARVVLAFCSVVEPDSWIAGPVSWADVAELIEAFPIVTRDVHASWSRLAPTDEVAKTPAAHELEFVDLQEPHEEDEP